MPNPRNVYEELLASYLAFRRFFRALMIVLLVALIGMTVLVFDLRSQVDDLTTRVQALEEFSRQISDLPRE